MNSNEQQKKNDELIQTMTLFSLYGKKLKKQTKTTTTTTQQRIAFCEKCECVDDSLFFIIYFA